MKKRKKQCEEKVWDSGSWHSYQCRKYAVVIRGEKNYCKIHDPEYKKRKEQLSQKKYDEQSCRGCKYHFPYPYYSYCPLCGQKKTNLLVKTS